MANLLRNMTDAMESLTELRLAAMMMADSCNHQLILSCGTDKNPIGWCAFCGLPIDQMTQNSERLAIPISTKLAKELSSRPLPVMIESELAPLIEVFFQGSNVAIQTQLVVILKSEGLEHHLSLSPLSPSG